MVRKLLRLVRGTNEPILDVLWGGMLLRGLLSESNETVLDVLGRGMWFLGNLLEQYVPYGRGREGSSYCRNHVRCMRGFGIWDGFLGFDSLQCSFDALLLVYCLGCCSDIICFLLLFSRGLGACSRRSTYLLSV